MKPRKFRILLSLLIICWLLCCCRQTSTYSDIPGVTTILLPDDWQDDWPRQYRNPVKILWSPKDSNRILVQSSTIDPPTSIVSILDIDSKGMMVVDETLSGGLDINSWSIDGNKVLLDSGGQGLYIIELKNPIKKEYLTEGHKGVWSPIDENVIIFIRKRTDLSDNQNEYNIQIIKIDPKTKTEEKLTTRRITHISDMTWSPDGVNLGLSIWDVKQDPKVTKWNIFTFNLSTNEWKKLTLKGSNTGVAWDPSGRIIAYIGQPNDILPQKLHLMNLDNGCDLEITQLEEVKSPTWSPDGKKIAFIGLNGGLYVLELDKLLGADWFRDAICP